MTQKLSDSNVILEPLSLSRNVLKKKLFPNKIASSKAFPSECNLFKSMSYNLTKKPQELRRFSMHLKHIVFAQSLFCLQTIQSPIKSDKKHSCEARNFCRVTCCYQISCDLSITLSKAGICNNLSKRELAYLCDSV